MSNTILIYNIIISFNFVENLYLVKNLILNNIFTHWLKKIKTKQKKLVQYMNVLKFTCDLSLKTRSEKKKDWGELKINLKYVQKECGPKNYFTKKF